MWEGEERGKPINGASSASHTRDPRAYPIIHHTPIPMLLKK